jgi:DDE superfamily endonuclease/Helix-turn-helix of DDE superfamily endonuclease
MLGYAKLSRSPSIFRSFSGLDLSEFDSVYAEVEKVYSSIEERRLSRGDRQRKIGAGHPFKLHLRDRLLVLLIYYRLYVTSTLLGFLFDLGQTNVLKDIRMIEPAVREVLPLPAKVYGKKRKLRTIEEIEELFPGFKALIDATEQEIPRPKDKKKRKTHYSGKKRRHTVKTQLAVNAKGLIVHRTNHARGRTHDYALFKRNHPDLPKKVRPVVDLGYNGIQNDYPEMDPSIPFKKKSVGRGHKGEKADELTPEQKAFNSRLSKERIVVEHTISRLKKFRVMGDEFRNRLRHYDMMTNIVSGLINLRILGTLDA